MSQAAWADLADMLAATKAGAQAIDDLHRRTLLLQAAVDSGTLTRDAYITQVTPLRMELHLLNILIGWQQMKIKGMIEGTTVNTQQCCKLVHLFYVTIQQ